MIRIGNKIVAGSADVDLSTVLKSLNKTGLSIWVGTQTEYDALVESVKNNEKTTFITYDTDEDIYLIVDTIISYGKTWSSVKISSELAKKINAADVYTKEQVDEIINSKLASALKYKGAVNTTALLPASAENGDTYFVKADGFMYAYNSTEADWDALGTVADMTNYFTKTEITAMLQDKADKFQYDVLPTPSSETVGVLLQYTGADTQDYKNGYWYKGIDNGDSTYDWELAKTGDYYSKSEVDEISSKMPFYRNISNSPNNEGQDIYINATNSMEVALTIMREVKSNADTTRKLTPYIGHITAYTTDSTTYPDIRVATYIASACWGASGNAYVRMRIMADSGNEYEANLDQTGITYNIRQINGLNYSTNETLTGNTWIDGKPIYRNVVLVDNIAADFAQFHWIRTYATGFTTEMSFLIRAKYMSATMTKETETYNDGSHWGIRPFTFNDGRSTQYAALNDKILIEYTKTTD